MYHFQLTAKMYGIGLMTYWTYAHIFVRHLDVVHLLSFVLVLTFFGSESGNISKGTAGIQ